MMKNEQIRFRRASKMIPETQFIKRKTINNLKESNNCLSSKKT